MFGKYPQESLKKRKTFCFLQNQKGKGSRQRIESIRRSQQFINAFLKKKFKVIILCNMYNGYEFILIFLQNLFFNIMKAIFF